MPLGKSRRAVSVATVLVLPLLMAACDGGGPPPPMVLSPDTSFDSPPSGDVVPIAGDSGCGYEADTDAGPAYLTPAEAGQPNPCDKPKPVAPPKPIPMETTPSGSQG